MLKYIYHPLSFLCLLFFGTGIADAQQNITYNVYSGQNEITATGSITLRSGFHIPQPVPGKSVRIYTTAGFGNCTPLVVIPSSNQNYVSTRIFKLPGVNNDNLDVQRNVCEVNQTVQYFDGLGRLSQAVSVQGSSNLRDVVQPAFYDAFDRENKKYLPYTIANNNGGYRSEALTEQTAFYINPAGASAPNVVAIPNAAFSETRFDNSPLNRVEEQGATGVSWQPGNGHTIRLSYNTNNIDTAYTKSGFAVRLYEVKWNANGFNRTLLNSGFYHANELSLTINKNENWTSRDDKAGTTEEYKDRKGRIVLKRSFNRTDADLIETLSTYYVYDNQGRLCFVLPPGANPDLGSISQTTLENFCYQYRYDGRLRLIERWLPGATEWNSIVYNTRDEVVLSQDANQKVKGQWVYNKYDGIGRLVITGLYNNKLSRDSLQKIADAKTIFSETRTGKTDYTNLSFPQTDTEVYTSNYYDDYNFPGGDTYFYKGASIMTRGLLTGSKVKVLGGSQPVLLSLFFYDDDGHKVKSFSQHNLGGSADTSNYDEVLSTYSFIGTLLANKRIHHAGGVLTTIANRYVYDHMNRNLATMESINQGSEIVLSKMDYNEAGQMVRKSLHSTDNGSSYLQSNNYTYNERGWLKSNNSPLFSFELKYQDGDNPQWNGNISNQYWGNNGTNTNNFSYTYDKLNRLLSGISKEGGMSELLNYDLMGNINTLSRDGGIKGIYNYTGNKLMNISKGPLATGDYSYDANGNTTTDGRSGVTLAYNVLNLPITATKSGLNLSYIYDATGNKLKKITTGTTRDYINGIEYNGSAIELIHTDEGVARRNGSGYSYEYNLTDHLGNVRYSFYKNPVTGKTDRIQSDDYYPFGLRKSSGATISLINKYLYNSKELQDELGQYDYGARFYDPVIGRWNVIDQLAEKHHETNPYNYVLNNPMSYIDPLGLDTSKAGSVAPIKPLDIVIGDNGQEIVNALPEIQVAANKKDESITDGNGRIKYKDGLIENFEYTGGGAGKYAVFTDVSGDKIYFPGVNISATLVGDGAGVTFPTGDIFMSVKDNGLEDLQHEYGHFLDYKYANNSNYNAGVMAISFLSTFRAKAYEILNKKGGEHKRSLTEVRANILSSGFFGPKSPIATSKYYPKK
ncbi:DUF6443 domain-containing protein [Pedobacter cryoconitis]|uniref:DUF6443 domain-containing protein n=1 Tax=Pedobacter cryoconitis TaxID=188932 RepID=UPI00160994AF|nr:DUF6443 domain-containing protein [Pedobacter cryoconitis]MBB5648149.1 RHS repeat-associated protein [Pedobacter cryoconitis]